MTRPVVFTGDIFRLQPRGGITRYFAELVPRLARPTRIEAGWHQSEATASLGLGPPRAGRVAQLPGGPRVVAAVNRGLDAGRLGRDPGAILHPTY